MFKFITDSVCESPLKGSEVTTPQLCKNVWFQDVARSNFFDNSKEHLIVICLDSKLKLKDWSLISIGTCNQSLANIADILKPVIISSSYGFVVMHNHPSGETNPSGADVNITSKIREAAKLMEVYFFDHVIVGENEFNQPYSFREMGLV